MYTSHLGWADTQCGTWSNFNLSVVWKWPALTQLWFRKVAKFNLFSFGLLVQTICE